MNRVAVFDRNSGRILQFLEAPNQDGPVDWRAPPEMVGVGFCAVAGVAPETHMIVDGAAVLRPRLDGFDRKKIRADGVDATRMAVPVGAEISVNGSPHGACDDGEIILTGDSPGVWRITVKIWPYMHFEEVVECLSP